MQLTIRQWLSYAAFFGIIFVLSLSCTPNAFADVRQADVIKGASVEDRGLSIAQCPSIDAEYACLVGSDGTVFFERGSSTPAQIASITKVMTAIVALDNAAADTHIAVSETAALIGESSAGLQEGDTMDLESALKALLVPSGNDAAQAIAETIGSQMMAADPSLGDDPVKVFVSAMNAKAQQIGCTDTLYENPHGLDDGEFAGSLHSTALDQSKVAACAMGYETIRNIVAGGSTSIQVMRDGEKQTIGLETTDLLLDLYDYAIGIKTGITDLAGPSFMGAADNGSFQAYAIVLDSSSEEQRFYDAMTLFEWVYEHMGVVQLANSDQSASMVADGETRQVPVVAEVAHADWIDKTVKATLADPDAAITVFDVDGNVAADYTFDEVHGDVHEGDKVGTVSYLQHNNVIAEQDLIACEDVSAPGFIDGVGIWWNRLLGGFSGTPDQANSLVYNVMPIIDDYVSNAA